ncbi:MAG: PEP-CTERM sorting domain-containing protein [Phycisphaeraceae bacterium]|nr:MAG: PEP-CTERM sorting domain-containing protein [Phycisphaeraceae bacterium]
MKNVIAMAAVAGLASAASASGVKMYFTADASTVNVGDTVGWTVSVTFTGLSSTGYFGGFTGSFLASDNSLGTASNMATTMNHQAVIPTANGADVNSINVFNSALLGDDDPSIGVFYTFDVTADAEGDLSYGASGLATLFNSDFIFDQAIEFTSFPVNTDTVHIVPAPGAVALLGLGGLVAGRRRR